MRQMTGGKEREAPAGSVTCLTPVAVVRCHMQGVWQSWDSDPAVCVPMALAQLLDQPVSKVSGTETLPRVQQCSVGVNQNNATVYQPRKNDQE